MRRLVVVLVVLGAALAAVSVSQATVVSRSSHCGASAGHGPCVSEVTYRCGGQTYMAFHEYDNIYSLRTHRLVSRSRVTLVQRIRNGVAVSQFYVGGWTYNPCGAHAARHHVRAHAAYVTVGGCVLHAYTPSAYPGTATGVRAHGRIDLCSNIDNSAHMALNVCLQVRGSGGTYFTKSETCHRVPSSGTVYAVSDDVYSVAGHDAVIGHVYRTSDCAVVNGHTACYTSSGVTYQGG